MPLDAATLTARTGPAAHLHGCRSDLWPPDTERQQCALCGLAGNDLRQVLDLGEQPLANALLSSPTQEYRKFPLQLGECVQCGHVQLIQTVRPDLMFEEYVYRTGMSGTMRQHFQGLAHWLSSELSPGSLICEVGCNDGTLLRSLESRRMRVVGVDPSSVAATIEGIPVHQRYFNERAARELRAQYGPVDCVVMTNVLAHVPQPAELIRGAWEMLRDGGLLVIEAPYVRDLVRSLAYDTIYHEHSHFFSLRDLSLMLTGKFWRLEVASLPVHGGSLRLVARRSPYADLSLYGDGAHWKRLLTEESTPVDWDAFRGRVERHRDTLRAAVAGARDLVGLYAPAKATVLLNYTGITPARIVDDTPEKQGRFVPGVGCPIVPRAAMGDPDLVLLNAWNFAEEVLTKEAGLRGRLLCPLPVVRML